MLTFPSLPTDSLYKFIFIAGVVLMVSAFYLMPKNASEHLSQQITMDSLQLKYRMQMDIIDDSLKGYDLKIASFEAEVDSIIKYHRKTSGLRQRFQKNILPYKYDKDILYSRQYTAKYDSLFNNRRVVLNSGFYDINQKMASIMLMLGIILFVCGAASWYFLLQSPQDELLKLQLKEARKKATISGRVHFEPKTLPRTQIRNNR